MMDSSMGSDLSLAERVAAGWQPPAPIPFTVDNRGKRCGDLLHTSGSFVVVASERFCALLSEIGATGWVTAPVAIHYKDGEELRGYRLLVTTGRCADFLIERDDYDDDVVEPVDVSVGWDGSDLFWFAAPSMGFLVTDRVKQAIVAAGMEGIEFEVPVS
jgi:hypothetical protein